MFLKNIYIRFYIIFILLRVKIFQIYYFLIIIKRDFKYTANILIYFIFLLPFLKQTNQNYWYLWYFDKATYKKYDISKQFLAIFSNFSAHAPPFKKRSFFSLRLPPLIRTQEGVKFVQIAKLHLNSIFYLLNFLPQSWNTKKGRLSGPQNIENYGFLYMYHKFYL